MDGTVNLRSFDDAHLWNPRLRALMQKIEVVENEEFTHAFECLPIVEQARITVLIRSGERLVGEMKSGSGDEDDQAAPKSDAQIERKFRGFAENVLGTKRTSAVLQRLWRLEEIENTGQIPSALVLD